MSNPVLVEFPDQDSDFECQALGSGIMIRLRHEECQITVGIDYASAWRLCDALAYVTSQAAVARAETMREVVR